MESSAGVVSKLLIGVPILAMALIGVLARSSTSNYGFVAYDAKQDAAINAYVPLVKETRADLTNYTEPNGSAARKIALDWISQARAGRLQLLEPVSIDDSARDGVKGEIVRANMTVGETLARISYLEAQAGKPDQAARDAALGAMVLQITKFSDFSSVTSCSVIQRRCLERVEQVDGKASLATMAAVKNELRAINLGDGRLTQMAVRQRQLYLQSQVRHGVGLAKIEETQKLLSPDEFTQADNLEVVERRIRTDLAGWRSEPFASFLSDVRLGYEAQVITDRKLDELLQTGKIYTL